MSEHELGSPARGLRAGVVRLPGPVWRSGWRVVVAGVVVAMAVLVVSSGADGLRPARAVRVAPVVFDGHSVAAVVAQDAGVHMSGVTVQAPGWLEAEPFYVACSALADGVVSEMLALEGEEVERGQVVARLVDDDARLALARAEAELAAALGAAEVARADSVAAQTDWDNPVERERAVSAGRAAVGETEAELARLPSLIRAERAMLESMSEELKRSTRAFERDALTEIELIIERQRVEAQRARVEAVERQEAVLTARRARLAAELAAAERDAELRVPERRALGTSRAALARAEADAARAQAARDEARLRLDRMTIRAPITGRVMTRLKAPGDKVMLGMDDPHSAHLLHLYDPSKLRVRVDVPLADVAHVYEGQRCEVVVDVLPDVKFNGEVARITHEADLQKNTLEVQVVVEDPSAWLRPEMLTRVTFLAGGGGGGSSARGEGVESATVRVSERCLVHRDGGRARVWAVRLRRSGVGVARAVDVEIEGTGDGWARVRGALHPGDLLITAADGIRDGQRVRVKGDMTEGGGA